MHFIYKGSVLRKADKDIPCFVEGIRIGPEKFMSGENKAILDTKKLNKKNVWQKILLIIGGCIGTREGFIVYTTPLSGTRKEAIIPKGSVYREQAAAKKNRIFSIQRGVYFSSSIRIGPRTD